MGLLFGRHHELKWYICMGLTFSKVLNLLNFVQLKLEWNLPIWVSTQTKALSRVLRRTMNMWALLMWTFESVWWLGSSLTAPCGPSCCCTDPDLLHTPPSLLTCSPLCVYVCVDQGPQLVSGQRTLGPADAVLPSIWELAHVHAAWMSTVLLT